jgi:hypothetical protein
MAGDDTMVSLFGFPIAVQSPLVTPEWDYLTPQQPNLKQMLHFH